LDVKKAICRADQEVALLHLDDGTDLVLVHSCRDARMFPAPGRGVPKNCRCCAYVPDADADTLWENGFGCRWPGKGDFILFNFNLAGTQRLLKAGAIKVLVEIVPRIQFLPPDGDGVQIYALCDPFDGKSRYVGKSLNAGRRLTQHVSENGTSRKVEWVGQCLLAGRQPKLKILEVVSAEAWPERERFWIAKLRAEGFDLLNVREGG